MAIIETRDLKFVYRVTSGVLWRRVKEIVALKNVSFSVEAGEVFGLVGANGAGKTTLTKILTTLLVPSSGDVRILGYDPVNEPRYLRQLIGFTFGGERGLYWRLSGYDNLLYFAKLYKIETRVLKQRIPYLLEVVGLQGREHEKVQGYSRGMRQRLHLVRALLHDPPLIFLDEPTMGLDPATVRDLHTTISQLRSEGKTIFLTTHNMHEAEKLSDRVAIVKEGNIVALDTPAALKQQLRNRSIIEVELANYVPGGMEGLYELDLPLSVALKPAKQGHKLIITTTNGGEAIVPILNTLATLNLSIGKVAMREPTLEDVYLAFMRPAQEPTKLELIPNE